MRYENPIIRGFNPDPSVCRVDRDYYLVTSSFEYFPGIPVYHSTDLVNWTQIGNCIERENLLPFEAAAAGQGMWAPTIRYHDGRFYVTATFHGFGNFIVHTENPAAGWSDPVKVEMTGIDPSLLFDDDRVYYCTNQRGGDDREAISLAEINPETGALLSPARVIWHGMSSDRPQYLEAPHVYHIGNAYYLLAAEGGTKENHMITVARSSGIWGPYESCAKPVVTNRWAENTGVACSGHGDLVEDETGNWWMVHLATRPDDLWYSHLGRETFLLPVCWEAGWPVAGDGVSRIHCEGPLTNPQRAAEPWRADFHSRQYQWLFLRKPDWSLYDFRGNALWLTPGTEKLSEPLGRPAFLALRQMDVKCVTEAEITFEPVRDGSEAGLTVYLADNAYYAFRIRREAGVTQVVVGRGDARAASVPVPESVSVVRLRIDANKRTYAFSCAFDGQEFRTLAEMPVFSRADAGRCFTGTLIGLYAQCEDKHERPAKITSFCMEPADGQ